MAKLRLVEDNVRSWGWERGTPQGVAEVAPRAAAQCRCRAATPEKKWPPTTQGGHYSY
jgi:hypothetical protein